MFFIAVGIALVPAVTSRKLQLPGGLLGVPGFAVLIVLSIPGIMQTSSALWVFDYLGDIVRAALLLWCMYHITRSGHDFAGIFRHSFYIIGALAIAGLLIAVFKALPEILTGVPLYSLHYTTGIVGFGVKSTDWAIGLALLLPCAIFLASLQKSDRRLAFARNAILFLLLAAIVGSQIISGGRTGLALSIVTITVMLALSYMRWHAAALMMGGLIVFLAILGSQQWVTYLKLERLGTASNALDVKTSPKLFDVRFDASLNRLSYTRDGCNDSDIEHSFFLHIYLVDPLSLPLERLKYGFDNRGFNFSQHGEMADGRCIADVALKQYPAPIRSIHTGQFTPGKRAIWEEHITIQERADDASTDPVDGQDAAERSEDPPDGADEASYIDKLDDFSTDRLTSMRNGIDIVLERPFTGHGIRGGLVNRSQEEMPSIEIHNLWLRWGANTGIFAPLLAAAMMISIITAGWHAFRRTTRQSIYRKHIFALMMIVFLGVMASMVEPNPLIGNFGYTSIWWASAGALLGIYARNKLQDIDSSKSDRFPNYR